MSKKLKWRPDFESLCRQMLISFLFFVTKVKEKIINAETLLTHHGAVSEATTTAATRTTTTVTTTMPTVTGDNAT